MSEESGQLDTDLLHESAPITAIDLFCGGGGASCGMTQAGVEVAAGVDHNEQALETHAENLSGEHIHHDLSDVDTSILPTTDVDWVHGSPPCQGFSTAKYERDPDDERNELVWSFVEWISELSPRFVSIENVAGMQSISQGFLETISAKLREVGEGYRVKWAQLNSADYGVPQTRKRLYFVAYRSDIPLPDRWFPRPTHAKCATTTLDGRELSEWRTIRETIGDLRPIPDDAFLTNPIGESEHQKGTRPLISPDSPAPTIRAARPTLGLIHNFSKFPESVESCSCGEKKSAVTDGGWRLSGQMNRLTMREMACLQTFPDWYNFVGNKTEKYPQIGNAIPPLQMQHIAEHLVSVSEVGE